mmetsp:Transcript_22539/g.27866  ORF Transcript_22539/g.27866 Transcript_22539/m.27866 type:complete len:88 (+) Transcript_22539:14-277(+)
MGSSAKCAIHSLSSVCKIAASAVGIATMSVNFAICIPPAVFGFLIGAGLATDGLPKDARKKCEKALAMILFIFYTCYVAALASYASQ